MLTDLRLALRLVAATPFVTLAAVLSLALGIGATVAAFSFVEGTALRPFPLVPRPDRVVRVRTAARGMRPGATSYPAFVAYRESVPAFAALGAYATSDFGLQPRPGTPAFRTWGAFTSADYFRVLGVGPALGRFYDDADERPGASPVVVLSHALWRERFGADPAAIGRSVTVNGRAATVVGVARPRFGGAEMLFRANLYVPLVGVLEYNYRPFRAGASLLGAFGALALALAGAGVFGALSYALAQRRRELGVRLALGARGRDVAWLLARGGLAPVAAGLAAGVPLALAGGRAARALLYGVSPADPRAALAGAGVLLATAALACWFPARRAGRVPPAVVLRAD